ncbi:MAG: hypothetical protein DYG89_54275, partial [Caldilinea sp. CFX5]|nr:hypothetical protein [Caldilinea sp. CFX5]
MLQSQNVQSLLTIRRSLNWTAISRLLLILALCLPAGSVHAQPLMPPRTQERLLHLAATQPESMVRVIVQQQSKTAAVADLVAQIGGRVVRTLDLIDGLVVELPAKAIPTLARANGVHYVSLDAPMQLTSTPLDATTMHSLLPLVMQAEESPPSEEEVVRAAATYTAVRDEFNTAAFNNNNGSVQWAGAWVENDTEAGGSGPTVGQVQIVNGALRLDDSPDTYGQPSIARQINLTGATAATLRFDYRTTVGVDSDDAVVVEVSTNGGATYTVLETFTNIVGEVVGSRSYNIANFIAGNTMIRFRVSNLYGATDEFFFVDNVQVEYSTTVSGVQAVTVRDEFGLADFNNNDGAQNWAAPWVENDTAVGGAGPTVGQVQIVNGQLGLDDTPDTGGQPSVARQVNLTGATSASLSFDYRTTIGVDPDDAVTVEVSNNGGASYTTLQTFTGITGISYGSRTFDIAGFMAANTMIRFRVSNLYGASEEFFYVDNVQITYTTAGSAPSGPSNVGRYFRLVAKSEVNGNPWTAVAELNALDANGNVIPKSGWSVISVNSQETIGEDGRGVNAIDGNPATHWHTQWYSATPTPPHQIVVDMGATYTLSGFRYLTRQDNTDEGNIANYSFYVSRDGVNWGAAVSAGTLLNTPVEQTVIF